MTNSLFSNTYSNEKQGAVLHTENGFYDNLLYVLVDSCQFLNNETM